ncbi:hypothetical protein NQ315_016526 [Exocentrus adspersus]|uniref:Fucosyltransferase n=1 Tax=Exocentrus adspersus TaxID=1586481 RepID=A0AAV8VYX7_9CUCU|nr:hypothetical protein NQ315_016526 [Exocentrus adspersus]
MLSYICSFKFKQLALLVIIYALCHFAVQVFFLLSLEETNRVPVLLWWTQFVHINKERVINCPNGEYQCLITTNHSNSADVAAYLFYGSRIENHDFPLPRNYAIPWAILHEESPKNYAPFLYRKTQSIFNITSTFSRYSDFPVTLQYLESVSSLRDSYYYVPVDTKNKYLKDIAPVLYIQSDCDTPINRDYLVKEFGKFINIDSYGKCLTNKMFPKEFYEIYSLDLYNEELLRFIAKYKFIVAFENAICEDYITEKLWRPLIVGSIPIYLGSPTIEDWLPNKNSAILVKNYNSLQEVANLIKKN